VRKDTVNLITAYQAVGAIINFITILFIVSLEIDVIEAVLTIGVINASYIAISRDWSRKQEMMCAARSIGRHKQHPDKNPIHHP